MERVPISGPSITEKEISYVTDAVTRCWYGNANLYHERFQAAFAAFLDVKHAIPLPSCTSAIHLALAALGIGPGDEVIVPESTWIATAAPISYLGARVVFADVDEMTWCLSAESVATNISSRTKAIIPVDLYGGVPDYDGLVSVCRPFGISIIEDAAESIGSVYHGVRTGRLGDVGVFSFHGSKTLTTGEGGMLVTNRDDIHSRVRVLQDHGRRPGDRQFINTEVAYKYKMSSMQAALGLAQLERVDDLVGRKRQIYAWYSSELSNVPGLTLNYEPIGTFNSYWMATIVLDSRYDMPKAQLAELLAADGIDTRPFFSPLSSLPAYSALGGQSKWRERNPVAYRLGAQAINLPSALNLSRADVRRVCDSLKKHLLGAVVGEDNSGKKDNRI